MQQEHVQPTAILAAAILAKVAPAHAELTDDIIAAAFAQAHRALILGMERVDSESPPPTYKIY